MRSKKDRLLALAWGRPGYLKASPLMRLAVGKEGLRNMGAAMLKSTTK